MTATSNDDDAEHDVPHRLLWESEAPHYTALLNQPTLYGMPVAFLMQASHPIHKPST